ncbi:hypothetical protein ACFQZ8_02120 [Micromonospora azadirachtae]|uniref:Uncharacterized protein n=1 Tax=Micromonospora azadirachtae TaxID=1970735 RepID=A0ABW2ZVR2_9ACTN
MVNTQNSEDSGLFTLEMPGCPLLCASPIDAPHRQTRQSSEDGRSRLRGRATWQVHSRGGEGAAGGAAEPRTALAPDRLSGVFITVTLRNVGTAAIVVGLLIAVLTLGTTTDRPFILALLFVVIGLGLRLEAAVRSRNGPHRGTGR